MYAPMHVHLIGVAGTGMGALAGLLVKSGVRVTGSDTAFHPPIGPALERWGVQTMRGWDPMNLEPRPDLVVVGNVCRKENPEARHAIDHGMPYDSMPGALERLFLSKRVSLVVAGTHGKTTSTSLTAWLLADARKDPGFLVGGIPANFGESFAVGHEGGPFVIEGDEYDSAFFEKTPKFFRYLPRAVMLTSIEHDHVDIYPDETSYLEAFRGLVARIPEEGHLVAFAGDPHVREIAREASCSVTFYAVEGDETGGIAPAFLATPAGPGAFDLFGMGSHVGRVNTPLTGLHNMRNALGAMALASLGAEVELPQAIASLGRFRGVKRRQELLGVAGGVRVYEDFAHHPTAVRETLRGLRERHPDGRLIAAFEPRSATASRRTHQAAYPSAFESADVTFIAPVGRAEIAETERLDRQAIAAAINASGGDAHAPADLDEVLAGVVASATEGDTIVLMSNGTFGGIYDRVIAALAARHLT
jgi:UDP-N-acetylmuramate: L-alanyl-gamma-D-glutamyl-meso-diaminopimelate ligase